MKKMFITFAALALMAASPVAAFDLGGGDKTYNTNTNTNTNLNTNSNTNIAAASSNQAQGQLQGQAQGQFQSLSGNNSSVQIQDRLQAPSVSAPSFSGGGHPCSYGSFSFGLSVVGGGGSAGGGSKIDNACLLAQAGYGEAAMHMIAQRDPDARKALEATGYIQTAPAPVASTRSAPAKARTVAYTSCKFDDGAIRVGVRRGADEATRAAAVSQCKAKLR